MQLIIQFCPRFFFPLQGAAKSEKNWAKTGLCNLLRKLGVVLFLLGFHYLYIFRPANWLGKTKNMCVSGYMLLKIRVGRSDYFFVFQIFLFA